MQGMVVLLLVVSAAGYALWSLSGREWRRAMLRVLEAALPMLRGPLSALRRRLGTSGGCTACSAATRGRTLGSAR